MRSVCFSDAVTLRLVLGDGLVACLEVQRWYNGKSLVNMTKDSRCRSYSQRSA
jgi:hypothetical protein